MANEEVKMVLPPPNQIGVVVKGLRETMDYYSRVFGIGPFRTVEFVPGDFWVKGKQERIHLSIGLAQWGPMEIELMEVVEGDTPIKWFLDEKGEGMQHLGIIVDNYNEWIDYLKKKGIGVLMSAEADVPGKGHLRASFVESNEFGGVFFEIKEWS